MRDQPLSQKVRFIILLFEVGILCLGSFVLFGSLFPPNTDKGFWFYTALLGVVLGSRLDTPFFARPADVILYAAPAAISLFLGSSWGTWQTDDKTFFVVAVSFCVILAFLSAFSILSIDAKSQLVQKISHSGRVIAEVLGTPRIIFFVVIAFALYSYHRHSPKEFAGILAVWILTAVLSPVEASFQIGRRIRRIWKGQSILNVDGEVVAYQIPDVVLIRQSLESQVKPGSFLAIKDPHRKARIGLALDYVGRDEGILLRAIEICDAKAAEISQIGHLPFNAVAGVTGFDGSDKNELSLLKENLVGIVASDTSIEKMFFEVVNGSDIEEGRLVEVAVGKRLVMYQLVNGLTKEEIVHQKNTRGYARAQAQKIGEWDVASKRFKSVKWLPELNAPVYLKKIEDFQFNPTGIGYFPGTNYSVTLREKAGENIGLQSLVTHNTAILGILGVGKSTLALELVERMMVAGIKVICIDMTSQYEQELSPYYDFKCEGEATKKLQEIGRAGKTNFKKNVEEGGSRQTFTTAVQNDLETFLKNENLAKLKIFNPSQFEVWRQDSKPFNNEASMASLSPAEITHIISEATLQALAKLGMTDKARACLVYEEAHSLVPEWNSSVAEGDKAASNGTARAILQGRKYGLGCLLITQRSANVTKTILNQCNTVFAMRLFDETGKDFLANHLGRDYAEMLPTIQERQAVFFGRASSCENPVLLQLNDRRVFVEEFRRIHPPSTPPSTSSKGPDNTSGEVPF